MIDRDSWGHSYLTVRGEILGFVKDGLLPKHLPGMFSLGEMGESYHFLRGRGSSAHTNLDHLYTQAFLTYCAMHSGSSAHTRFLSSGSSVHTHTFGRVGGWGGGIGKHTRSSAPAQHCGGGGGGGGGEGGMVSTPAQVHPLSAVSTHAEE